MIVTCTQLRRFRQEALDATRAGSFRFYFLVLPAFALGRAMPGRKKNRRSPTKNPAPFKSPTRQPILRLLHDARHPRNTSHTLGMSRSVVSMLRPNNAMATLGYTTHAY